MSETIKTITDKNKFEDILTRFYSGKNVYLKTKSGDLNIQYLGYSNDNAAFRIPRVKNCPDVVLLISRFGSSNIYATMKYVENKEDTFVFIPVKFQVIAEDRKEDRKEVAIEGNDRNVIFLSNVMSDFLMQNILAGNLKKLDTIKESLSYDLKTKFERIRIIFINEAKGDPRMKHIQDNGTPIFIGDMSEKPAEKDEKQFNYYINEIYAKDYKLNNDKTLISEITVPLFYRSIIPFGYLQVNGKFVMTETHLTVIKRMAIMVNEFFHKENLFQSAKDRFLVSDLSPSGLGVVFRDRKLTRFFRQGSLVAFDMILPSNKKVIMGALVRNIIFNQNGIIKVGFEIKHVDALSQVNYDEYLEGIGDEK